MDDDIPIEQTPLNKQIDSTKISLYIPSNPFDIQKESLSIKRLFRHTYNSLFTIQPPKYQFNRLFVYFDLDMFYAQVEQLISPKTGPLGIGSMVMLAACNYEARAFGVKAGMPGYVAKQMCPNLVIVPPNFKKINYFSNEIMSILAKFDEQLEIFGIDEACLSFDREKLDNVVNVDSFFTKEEILEMEIESSKFTKNLNEKIENFLRRKPIKMEIPKEWSRIIRSINVSGSENVILNDLSYSDLSSTNFKNPINCENSAQTSEVSTDSRINNEISADKSKLINKEMRQIKTPNLPESKIEEETIVDEFKLINEEIRQITESSKPKIEEELLNEEGKVISKKVSIKTSKIANKPRNVIYKKSKNFKNIFKPNELTSSFTDTSSITPKNAKPIKKSSNFVKIQIKETNKLLKAEEILEFFTRTDLFVRKIRKYIFKKTNLTISAGISHTKGLAKYCNGINKPNNQFIDLDFDLSLPVDKINGIGSATKHILDKFMNIKSIGELRSNASELYKYLPQKSASNLINLSYGFSFFDFRFKDFKEPNNIVEDINTSDVNAVNRGVSKSFVPTTNMHTLYDILYNISVKLHSQIVNLIGKNLTLKIRYSSFKTISKSLKITKINSPELLFDKAIEIFKTIKHVEPISQLGLSINELKKIPNFNFKEGDKAELVCPICEKVISDMYRNVQLHVEKCFRKLEELNTLDRFLDKN